MRIGCRNSFNQGVLTPGQVKAAIEPFALSAGIEADGYHHNLRNRCNPSGLLRYKFRLGRDP